MSDVIDRAVPRGASPVRRLLPWVGAEWKRLTLGVFLGAMAIGCGVGLMAVSAWLISSAALRPPILELEVAIVAVRAFGLGRGVFRYAERLVSHDAAFRALSRLRLAVYDRLAVVAPAGVPAYRRGDLLERLVRDVDATQDLPLRVLQPYVSGAVVALASVVLAWFILPVAGVVLGISLLLAATVVPWITARAAADADRASAPARGDLNGDVLTLLDGVGDLSLSGAAPAWLDRLATDDRRIGDLAGRSARAAGLASGLGVLLSGGAVVAMLLVAIPALRSGELAGVNLAVLVLLPLATYEAVVAMPTAALALGRVRGSAQRVVEVLDAVDPVPDPAEPAAIPAGVVGLALRGVSAGWPGGPAVLDGLDLVVAPGARVGLVGSSGAGKSTLLAVLAGFLPYDGSIRLTHAPATTTDRPAAERPDSRVPARASSCTTSRAPDPLSSCTTSRALDPVSSCTTSRAPTSARWSGGARSSRTCSTPRWWRTCGWPSRTRTTTRCGPPSTPSASGHGSRPRRSASTPRSGTTAPSCPGGSGSGSASPGCCSPGTRWCSSTSRPSTSTRSWPTSWRRSSSAPSRAAPSSGSRTAPTASPPSTPSSASPDELPLGTIKEVQLHDPVRNS